MLLNSHSRVTALVFVLLYLYSCIWLEPVLIPVDIPILILVLILRRILSHAHVCMHMHVHAFDTYDAHMYMRRCMFTKIRSIQLCT